MKTKLLATALTIAVTTTSVQAGTLGKYEEQRVGTGLGVLVGTAVAGPIGAIVAGYIGNQMGKSNGQGNELVQLQNTVNDSQQALAVLKAQKHQQLQLAEQKVQTLQQQLAQRQNQYEQQMAAIHQRTTLDNSLAVSLQFRTGSAQIEPVYQQHLLELATLMKSLPQYKLNLSGYADRQGEEKYNQDLSLERANAVKSFLVSQGIEGARITTEAYGESQPLQAQQTLQSDFFDRRVMIKLAPEVNAVVKN